jgi:hypothetical protein
MIQSESAATVSEMDKNDYWKIEKISMKETAIFLCLCAFFLFTGCSSEKEQKSLSKEKSIHGVFEKVLKEKENISQSNRSRIEDESSERKKQEAAADACSRHYASCLEKCSSTSCETACQNTLSACEKDLPLDLKILKK